MRRLAPLLVLALLAAQALVALGVMLHDATDADLDARHRALTAPPRQLLEHALGKSAAIFELTQRELARLEPDAARHAVIYLLPSHGLPTNLDDLAVLQNQYGAPLSALLQPASVRLLDTNLAPGPLIGDEPLFVIEIGVHVERPFMALLETLAMGPDFRIYGLPAGTSL
jgi:hypothetical protein